MRFAEAEGIAIVKDCEEIEKRARRRMRHAGQLTTARGGSRCCPPSQVLPALVAKVLSGLIAQRVECLAIRVARGLRSIDVIGALSDLIPQPQPLRQWPRVRREAVQDWVAAVGARTADHRTRKRWENGFVESFNAWLRDELLNGEIRRANASA